MTNIGAITGDEAKHLLEYRCTGISKESLHLPGPDYVDRVVAMKDRRTGVLRSMQALYGHGRLANTGYLSLLPVDQGVEHSGGASFAPTQFISIPKISSSSPSKAAATVWPRRSAYCPRWHGAMRTKFRSS